MKGCLKCRVNLINCSSNKDRKGHKEKGILKSKRHNAQAIVNSKWLKTSFSLNQLVATVETQYLVRSQMRSAIIQMFIFVKEWLEREGH